LWMGDAHGSIQQTLGLAGPNTQQNEDADGKWFGGLEVAGSSADVSQAPAAQRSSDCGSWPRVDWLGRGRRRGYFDFPIRRRVVDAPKVARSVQFETDQPGLGIAAEGHDLRHSSRGVPFCRNNFEAHLQTLRNRAGSDHSASVGIDQGGIALLGKRHRRVETRYPNRHLKWQSRAAANRALGFFRRAHRVRRRSVLWPEYVELESSFDNAGCDRAQAMLNHEKAGGTKFRRAVSQIGNGRAASVPPGWLEDDSVLAFDQAAGILLRRDVLQLYIAGEGAEQGNSFSDEHGHASDNETLDQARAQKALDRDSSVDVEVLGTAGGEFGNNVGWRAAHVLHHAAAYRRQIYGVAAQDHYALVAVGPGRKGEHGLKGLSTYDEGIDGGEELVVAVGFAAALGEKIEVAIPARDEAIKAGSDKHRYHH
jgi:hypothetical protein